MIQTSPTANACSDATIRVNGSEQPLRENETVADLLAREGYSAQPVATAVNGRFVPISARSTHALEPGDSIEILAPRAGG